MNYFRKLFFTVVRKLLRMLLDVEAWDKSDFCFIYGLQMTEETYDIYIQDRRKNPKRVIVQMQINDDVKENVVMQEIARVRAIGEKKFGDKIILGTLFK